MANLIVNAGVTIWEHIDQVNSKEFYKNAYRGYLTPHV